MAIITGIRMDSVQSQMTDGKAAGVTEQTEKASISFTNLMKQSVAAGSENLQKDTTEPLAMDTKQSGNHRDEAVYTNKLQIQTREDNKLSTVSDEVKEKLQEFEKDVNQILEEQLDVSQEEIETAMETLGLTYGDLLNPQNITALVGELSGTQEPAELLLSTELQDVLGQMSGLIENLSQDVNLKVDEMAALMQEMELVDAEEQTESLVQEIQEQLNQETTEDTVVVADPNQEASIMESGNEKNAVPVETVPIETIPVETTTVKAESVKTEQTPVAVETVEAPQEKEVKQEVNSETEAVDTVTAEEDGITAALDAKEEQSTDTGKGQQQEGQLQNDDDLNSNVIANSTVQQNETVQSSDFQSTMSQAQYLSQVQTEDIIQQISQQARTGMVNGTTSLEMQLNPENLGKILLQVTEKEGVIRAQLVTQNEAVKAALETQMADLRQNLNQQGIKVDAVEVTVSSHAFEENLEQNHSGEQAGQSQNQERGNHFRRNMNLDEMDSLEGNLTEAEALTAEMMKTHGNKVDMTA